MKIFYFTFFFIRDMFRHLCWHLQLLFMTTSKYNGLWQCCFGGGFKKILMRSKFVICNGKHSPNIQVMYYVTKFPIVINFTFCLFYHKQDFIMSYYFSILQWMKKMWLIVDFSDLNLNPTCSLLFLSKEYFKILSYFYKIHCLL